MTIQEIKSRLSILLVIGHYGIKVGNNGMIPCPFHQDEKPSMKVYLKTNTVYCFAGSCRVESLDVIDFIMHMERISKHQAILRAKSMLLDDDPPRPKLSHLKSNHHSDQNTIIMQSPNPNPDVQLLTELFSYFQKGIKHPQAKTAKKYKESRGLNGKLEIGYNSGKFHNNKPQEVVDRLMGAGLLKPSEHGYQIWGNKCLMWPLRNKLGEIVSLYGRSILDDGHYYLQNRKGLYPGYPDLKVRHLVFTESVIDASSLLQMELPLEDYAVLALYGTNGLTTEHRQAILQSLHLEEIIFVLDGDESGRRATEKHVKALKVLHPKLKYTSIELPEGEDINSMCVAHDEVEQLFSHLFENRNLIDGSSKKQSSKKSKEIKASVPAKTEKPIVVPQVESKLITDNEEVFIYGSTRDLLIYIMGGIRLEGLDRLRVTLKLHYTLSEIDKVKTFRDSLDLYSAMQVEKFVKRGSSRLEISSKLLQESMDEMTNDLEKYRMTKLESKKDKKAKIKVLSKEEERLAKKYLSSKNLMKRTGEDIGKSGVIGEELNRLVLFIIYLSRKMKTPMHALIFGKSGSGKTHLQSGVAALVPEEDKLETTTLSDNAVYYFGENEISHFLIVIEDMDGAEGALLGLRELQSKEEVRKTVTIKDEKGRSKTVTMIVKGPICLSGCTTRERMYEDNANRSFLIYVDSSTEQDERIMEYQCKDTAGKIDRALQQKIREEFKNRQRLLKPIKVVNPYGEYIRIPKEVFKPRRTNAHVLRFIEAVTFYHQYQREIKVDPSTAERYIETTIEDIEWAFRLLEPILLRKSDELSGGCRKFYEQLKHWLKTENKKTFYQKEIRNKLRMNPSNVKYYIQELRRYDHLKIVGGSRYHGGMEYEVKQMEDYEELKGKIAACFTEILTKLKKVSG